MELHRAAFSKSVGKKLPTLKTCIATLSAQFLLQHVALHYNPPPLTRQPGNIKRIDFIIDRTSDTLAERLRRRPAKPMGSPRVGSNPTGVVFS